MDSTKTTQSILILDDDTIQARVLSNKLLQLGYNIAAVTFTGTEAVIQTKRKQPDIVLLDINLNGQSTNGIEVGRAIQKINKNIIIIYITAYASNENFKQALYSIPSAFINKPYDIRTLDRQIELAINQINQKGGDITCQPPLPQDFRLLCFPNHLKIKENDGYTDWLIKDFYYLEANGSYTILQSNHKKNIVVIGLGKLEEKLLDYSYPQLTRIHHKFLINIEHIQTLNVAPKSGGIITMIDGRRLPVSRSYAQEFWNRYINYFEQVSC